MADKPELICHYCKLSVERESLRERTGNYFRIKIACEDIFQGVNEVLKMAYLCGGVCHKGYMEEYLKRCSNAA